MLPDIAPFCLAADAPSDLLNQRLWLDWLWEVRIEPGRRRAFAHLVVIESVSLASHWETSALVSQARAPNRIAATAAEPKTAAMMLRQSIFSFSAQ